MKCLLLSFCLEIKYKPVAYKSKTQSLTFGLEHKLRAFENKPDLIKYQGLKEIKEVRY
jgi:hypothetical protein